MTTPFVMVVTTFVMVVTTLSPVKPLCIVIFVGKLFVERPFVVGRMVAPRVLFSTLGVVAVAACLVALGDYHGYEGPVALAVAEGRLDRGERAEQRR